jgi:hypothetical protein
MTDKPQTTGPNIHHPTPDDLLLARIHQLEEEIRVREVERKELKQRFYGPAKCAYCGGTGFHLSKELTEMECGHCSGTGTKQHD